MLIRCYDSVIFVQWIWFKILLDQKIVGYFIKKCIRSFKMFYPFIMQFYIDWFNIRTIVFPKFVFLKNFLRFGVLQTSALKIKQIINQILYEDNCRSEAEPRYYETWPNKIWNFSYNDTMKNQQFSLVCNAHFE